jgi:hypothetical protein
MVRNSFFQFGKEHGRNKWWMYLATLLLAGTGYVIGQIPVTILIFKALFDGKISANDLESNNASRLLNPDILQADRNLFLILVLLTFVFCLAGLWLGIKLIMKKDLRSFISPGLNIRYRRIVFSFLVWSGLIILFVAISFFINKEEFEIQFNLFPFLSLFVISILLIPIQTTTEELLFRGFLMQGLGQATRSVPLALILSSFLFGAMHLMNPEVEKHGILTMLPYYTSFGLFLGFITIIDEGLEIPIGVHAANNLVMALLITSENSVLQTDSILKSKEESPGNEFLAWIIIVTLFSIILWFRYRWKNIKWTV